MTSDTSVPIGEQAGDNPKPVTDLSPRVVELARFIDRLPPGTHLIELEKPEVRALDWNVVVSRKELNRRMSLPKRIR